MKKNKEIPTINDIMQSEDWKNTNQEYLQNLQKFFDLADNIENENLKKMIVRQMLRCDDVLTNLIKDICKNSSK